MRPGIYPKSYAETVSWGALGGHSTPGLETARALCQGREILQLGLER